MAKTAKLYVLDSGLLSFMLGADERRFADDGGVAGALLESFVAMELLRQSDWSEQPLSLFHYRDKEQREVDVVLGRNSGEVACVEVKAAATVTARDLAGLRDRLERLSAVPVSGLWA